MPSQQVLIPTVGSEPADEWCRLGIESNQLNDWAKSENQFLQALRLDPQHVASQNNLACNYAMGGGLLEAAVAIDKAVFLIETRLTQPRMGEDKEAGMVYANQAMIYSECKRHGEAVEAASCAVAFYTNTNTLLAKAMTNAAAGRPRAAVLAYEALLKLAPNHVPAAQNICFARTLTDDGPAELVKQQRYYHDHFKGECFDVPLHQPSLNGKPIRVGYVSGDFKRHSAPLIFGAVALHHSPAVEPYFYSSLKVDSNDFMTKKFMEAAGLKVDAKFADTPLVTASSRWRDISEKNDEECDALIRHDRIDILVDLSAHSGGGRLPLFMRKPAPIQVTAWGFAHGTGCPEVDYFFADPVVIPESERHHYAEEIVDLPCIVTYNPPTEYNLPAYSRPPVNRNGYITFGCYCRFEKLSDEYLECVRQILTAVPDSRMEFKDDAFRRRWCCERVASALCPVSTSRLLFSGGSNQTDHMLAYQQSDLILDPFPHCGGTCCMEQLYMGVPLVTLYGKSAAGRTAASVLTAMDREYWVSSDKEDYVKSATAAAKHGLPELAAARKTLRRELLDSPVCKGYVAAVEEKYRWMIERSTRKFIQQKVKEAVNV